MRRFLLSVIAATSIAVFTTIASVRDIQAVRDRWAIVAYLRALQLSQGASLADLTPAARQALDRATP